MTDAAEEEKRAKPALGHKQCSECYNGIVDLTGVESPAAFGWPVPPSENQ